MSILFRRKLPIPKGVKEKYPLAKKCQIQKANREAEIKKVLSGQEDKLLMIIGPCSADREDAVLDYVCRLAKVQEKVKDKIFIVPRVYTSKPRTAGVGYKGILHQPDSALDDDMLEGIITVRRLHINVIEETGLSAADEILYPEYYRYFSDLISYAVIGARSTENQQHRLLSSGLETPVGMKNPTSGDLSVMLNSIASAQKAHTFLYRGYEVKSTGNPFSHGILRGATRDAEHLKPNYHYDDLKWLYERYLSLGLDNPAVIVDANHANSGKQWKEQSRICKEVIRSCRNSTQINSMVKGFMVESYIEDGNQEIAGGVYGKSVTDPCMGWERTEEFIFELAEMI